MAFAKCIRLSSGNRHKSTIYHTTMTTHANKGDCIGIGVYAKHNDRAVCIAKQGQS